MIDKVALLHVRDGRLLSTRSRGRDACYLPGGKREAGETDEATLRRELREELGTDVSRARPWGAYRGAAHAQAEGVEVALTCWTGVPDSEPAPHAEIEEVVWLAGDEVDRVSATHRRVLADLRAKNVLRPDLGVTGRAVLFDLDDTLLLTREVKWAQHRHVARENYGIELTDEVLTEHWGKPFDRMVGLLYGNSDTQEAMLAAYAAAAPNFRKTPVPGAVDAVTRLLDSGIAVGVVTATRTDYALEDLTRCGFPVERLVLVRGADLSTAHKPDPAVFDGPRDTLAALGVERLTYVGDALMDAAAADGAGLDFLAVTTGLFGAEEFAGHRHVGTITEVADVLLAEGR